MVGFEGFFKNVVMSLRYMLPYYTDLFSNTNSITSMVFNATSTRITTATPHLLQVGNYCIIKDVRYVYLLTDINHNTATGVLTGKLPDVDSIIKPIAGKTSKSNGVEGDYNSESVSLKGISDDGVVTLQLPLGLTQIVNLSIYTIPDYKVNDSFSVASVIDATNFEVDYINEHGGDDNPKGGYIASESNVTGGMNIDNFNGEFISAINYKNAIYVEDLGDEVSRSSASGTDSKSPGTGGGIDILTNSAKKFRVYFISEIFGESTTVEFVDRAQGEVHYAIMKVLQQNSDLHRGALCMFDGSLPYGSLDARKNLSGYMYDYSLSYSYVAPDFSYDRSRVGKIKKLRTT